MFFDLWGLFGGFCAVWAIVFSILENTTNQKQILESFSKNEFWLKFKGFTEYLLKPPNNFFKWLRWCYIPASIYIAAMLIMGLIFSCTFKSIAIGIILLTVAFCLVLRNYQQQYRNNVCIAIAYFILLNLIYLLLLQFGMNLILTKLTNLDGINTFEKTFCFGCANVFIVTTLLCHYLLRTDKKKSLYAAVVIVGVAILGYVETFLLWDPILEKFSEHTLGFHETHTSLFNNNTWIEHEIWLSQRELHNSILSLFVLIFLILVPMSIFCCWLPFVGNKLIIQYVLSKQSHHRKWLFVCFTFNIALVVLTTFITNFLIIFCLNCTPLLGLSIFCDKFMYHFWFVDFFKKPFEEGFLITGNVLLNFLPIGLYLFFCILSFVIAPIRHEVQVEELRVKFQSLYYRIKITTIIASIFALMCSVIFLGMSRLGIIANYFNVTKTIITKNFITSFLDAHYPFCPIQEMLDKMSLSNPPK